MNSVTLRLEAEPLILAALREDITSEDVSTNAVVDEAALGEVRLIAEVIPADLKIPHIGWNALDISRPHPIFKSVRPGDCVYFVHSYYGARCDESVIATAEYGANLTAAVARGNVCGCQFHPEKSGDVGLGILKAFCEWDGVEPC